MSSKTTLRAGAVARSVEAWSAPDSTWRERLAGRLPLFSRAVIDLGISRALASWDRAALEALEQRARAPRVRAPARVLVWLASSVPTAAMSAISVPLLAGARVEVRAARSDRASAALFRESLAAVEPEVAEALVVHGELAHDAYPTLAASASAIVAYGSDPVLETLRARTPLDRIFVAHGHRVSAAVIGSGTQLEPAARRLGLDLALWDGRGCLSPAYVLVDDRPEGRARAFAEALALELGDLREKLPRGELAPGEQLALLELRASLVTLDGAVPFLSRGGTDYGVVVTHDDAPPAGWLRNVPLMPFRGLEALGARLAPLAPALSTLGHVGFAGDAERLAELALRAGASRLCPLGHMQSPPVDWSHDGRDPLEPLLRRIDVEPESETRTGSGTQA